MIPFLLTVAIFASFWIIGLATLVVLAVDTATPWRVLSAPVFGAVVTALTTFTLSDIGLPINTFAIPLTVLLLGVSLFILVRARPPIARVAYYVAPIVIAATATAASPMFTLGFNWLGIANDDMANYSMSAYQLIHHGLMVQPDLNAVIHGTDYSTTLSGLHLQGSRPGSDLILGLISDLTGKLSYQVFMPVIFAFLMTAICGACSFAASVSKHPAAPVLTAVLLGTAALSSYGVLTELIAQTFGLGVFSVLFAWLLRPEIHRDRVPYRSEILPLGLLVAGAMLAYIELTLLAVAVYAIFGVVNLARRRIRISETIRMWVLVSVTAVVILNRYFPYLMSWLKGQAAIGSGGNFQVYVFGFSLTPEQLPTALGLVKLDPDPAMKSLGAFIIVSGIILIAASIAAIWASAKGSAIAAVVLADVIFVTYLGIHRSDFAVFKVSLYAQPFLAVGAAVCISKGWEFFWHRRWRVLSLGTLAASIVALVVVNISTTGNYLAQSRNPGVMPDASNLDLFPLVQHTASKARGPIIAVGDNQLLSKLEAIDGEGHPMFFVNRFPFDSLLAREDTAKQLHVQSLTFKADVTKPVTDTFEGSPQVTQALSKPGCTLVVPSERQVPFNGLSLPGSIGDLGIMPCQSGHDLLAFVDSKLGRNFYFHNRSVTLYQLQADPGEPGSSFSAIGQYLLFRVIGPTLGMRLEMSYTVTDIPRSTALPKAEIVGSRSVPLPVIGSGSARVISAPLVPEVIDRQPYLLLDMNKVATLIDIPRTGVNGIFGASVKNDVQFVTAFLRDASLISAKEYSALRAPVSLPHVRLGLANRNLQYSGIYEDGWVARDSYVMLAGGQRAQLSVSGYSEIGQRLNILSNGTLVKSVAIRGGSSYRIQAPLASSTATRKIEFQFSKAHQISSNDYRFASALLKSISITPVAG